MPEPEILTGEVIKTGSQRRAIIPEPVQRANLKATTRYHADLNWHRARFHGLRLPGYLVLTITWAALGLARIALALTAWWWVAEQTYLRHEAVAANDARTWLTLHKHAREARLIRGCVLLAGLAAAGVLAGCITAYLPWLWTLVIAAVVPWLATIGRPASKPIVKQAVVPAYVEPLTQTIVIRGLSVLGITLINQGLAKYPDDPEKVFEFRDPIVRDGPGWRAPGDLPHGVTAGQVMEKRNELASGLRRKIGCVWPENDRKRHPGALSLWVGDEDMSKAEQLPWPLAKRGTVDLFSAIPFANDQRGRAVAVTLMYASLIIGSIPRMGKNVLAAAAADLLPGRALRDPRLRPERHR